MSDKGFRMMSTKNLCLLSVLLIRVRGGQVNMDWSDSTHHMLARCQINTVSKLNYESALLPPAYVVRREGNTFTLLVCPQGGVPISHNALQYFPECHGAARGGGTHIP